MLTRLWVPREKRIAVDVDFLALYSFNVEETGKKLYHVLSITDVTDGVFFNLDSWQIATIWAETEFPGVRVKIDANFADFQRNIQIDVGFGDPLLPPAEWLDYPTFINGETVKLQAVCPETMLAWKLHGLVEQGMKRWRPKDMYDVMLLTTFVKLDEKKLTQAIPLAFNSRNTDLKELLELLSMPIWLNNSKNRSKWSWYRRQTPTQIMPTNLDAVVNIVINKWKIFVENLSNNCNN